MGKIEEALEKAKKMREKREEKEETPSPEIPLSPAYAQTKVIPTDLLKLEKNKVIAATKSKEAYEYYRFLKTQILHRMEKMDGTAFLLPVLYQVRGKQ